MRPLLSTGTRFRPDCSDQAKVAKLCITPLGAPVVPEVYMIVLSSLPSRTGSPGIGAVSRTRVSQLG